MNTHQFAVRRVLCTLLGLFKGIQVPASILPHCCHGTATVESFSQDSMEIPYSQKFFHSVVWACLPLKNAHMQYSSGHSPSPPPDQLVCVCCQTAPGPTLGVRALTCTSSAWTPWSSATTSFTGTSCELCPVFVLWVVCGGGGAGVQGYSDNCWCFCWLVVLQCVSRDYLSDWSMSARI